MVILRCQLTFYDQWFRRYRIGHFWPFFGLFGQKMVFLVVWRVYNIWKTNRKVGVPVEMRGQTTSYDKQLSRYRKWLKIEKSWMINELPVKCKKVPPEKSKEDHYVTISWKHCSFYTKCLMVLKDSLPNGKVNQLLKKLKFWNLKPKFKK